MYGLPKNIDLAFLGEKPLQQVCIGFNEVILRFDNHLEITITSECDYRSRTNEVTRIEEYPVAASMICQLLGSSIVEAKGSEDGTLFLRFSGEDTLTIYNDSKEYESYQIKHGSRIIVV